MFIVKIIIQVKSVWFSEYFQAHGKKETQLKLYKFVLESPPRHAACTIIISRFLFAMCQSELC